MNACSQSFQEAHQVSGNYSVFINDMITDASGNIYVVGTFDGTIILGSQTYTAQGTDIWLAKYNSSGSFIWGKAIPDTGTNSGDDAGNSITLDDNNNVYICGNYMRKKDFNPGGPGGTVTGNEMRFFAKYNSSGSFQWVKTVDTSGNGFDAIAFSSAHGRIYVGGNFYNGNNDVDFDPGTGFQNLNEVNGRAFIASYTLNGAIIDAVNFGSSSYINDLAVDPAGNVYATGRLSGSTSINLNPSGPGTSYDPDNGGMFVAKYSSGLGFTSAAQISGDPFDHVYSVIAPENDQIIYGGSANEGLYLARRNSGFNVVFEKSYGGSGAVRSIAVNGSDLYFAASSSQPGSSIDLGNDVILEPVNTQGDILMAKTDLSGKAIWGAVIPVSNGDAITTSVAVDGSSYFIMAGHFTGSTDFNACQNSSSLSANGRDGFMVRYSGDIFNKSGLSGPSIICTSNETFTLSNVPSGYPITWSKSSNLNEVSGQGTTSYTVEAGSSANGAGWVEANIEGACGVILQHEVWIGSPIITGEWYSYNNSPQYPLQPYYSVPNNEVAEVPAYVIAHFTAPVNTFSDIQFIDASDPSITWGFAAGSEEIDLNFDFYDYDQWVIFKVTASNSCGPDEYDVAFYSVEDEMNTYSSSPNPADDHLLISYNSRADSVIRSANENYYKIYTLNLKSRNLK